MLNGWIKENQKIYTSSKDFFECLGEQGILINTMRISHKSSMTLYMWPAFLMMADDGHFKIH